MIANVEDDNEEVELRPLCEYCSRRARYTLIVGDEVIHICGSDLIDIIAKMKQELSKVER